MIRGKGHFRMPDPLLLLAAAVVLGAVVTTAATAGESFNFVGHSHAYYRESPQDGTGLPLARLGRTGVALHLSLAPPREISQGFIDDGAPPQGQEPLSHVFLFLTYPW